MVSRGPEGVPKRVLIICIDRDDDLGLKTGLRGPIVGVDANTEAATRLALADPQEADANAIFGAIKAAEEVKRELPEAEVEVVTITGHHTSELLADQEIIRQMAEVTSLFKPDHAILVSDGADDERVIPLLLKFVPTISVRRVIVQQSRQLEETYFLIRRYIERLLESPEARAYALGVPGALLALAAILSLLNLQKYLTTGFILFMGLLLMEKGFSISNRLIRAVRYFGGATGIFSLFFGLAGISVSAYQAYRTASSMAGQYPASIVVGTVLKNTSHLFFLFTAAAFIGSAIESYALGRGDYLEKLLAVAVSFSAWLACYYSGEYLLGRVGMVVLGLGLAASLLFSIASLFFLRAFVGGRRSSNRE